MPLIRISNLEVAYGVIKAIQGVSLDVESGEIVTLIGSNGAGKTTLLRTISGLLRPTGGSILWNDGEQLVGLKPHTIVARGISHAPEGRQVFPNLTVRENLLLGGYQEPSKDRLREGIDRAFTLFPRLQERQRQRAGTLSGGEQQMLAIARGLMARPKLLLLDEPSMGLAPFLVNEIFRIIGQLHEQGIAIVLVEQNVKKALKITRRAYVMELGKILYHGDSKDLMADDRVRKCYLGET